MQIVPMRGGNLISRWTSCWAAFWVGVAYLISGCGEAKRASPNSRREALSHQALILGHWKVTAVLDEEATRADLQQEGLSREKVGGELDDIKQRLSQTQLAVVFRPDGTLTSISKGPAGQETTHTERWEMLESSQGRLTLRITHQKVRRTVKLQFQNPDQFQIAEDRAPLVQALQFERQREENTPR
ncbi:MAG: hypothetical protein KDA84_10305 [Planctomycetaceae bacterium]|nr:hypothetical protein [Planctomycetaceae bacterium]